jgi:hypothetical protein
VSEVWREDTGWLVLAQLHYSYIDKALVFTKRRENLEDCYFLKEGFVLCSKVICELQEQRTVSNLM